MLRTNTLGALAAAAGALVAVGLLTLMMLVVEVRPAEAGFPGQNGRIAFLSTGTIEENPELNVELFTMGPNGTNRRMLTDTRNYRFSTDHPAWSPDGTQIAFSGTRNISKYGWDKDIFTIRPRATSGTRVTRLADNADGELEPAWSPDGKKVIYVGSGGNFQLWVMNADGTGQTQLTNGARGPRTPAWSPDGTKIAFTQVLDNGSWELYVMNADGTGQRRFSDVFPVPEFCYRYDPDWSPDGKEIAFTYQCAGLATYAMSADGTAQRKVSVGSGHALDPTWSPDGRKIAYLCPGVGDNYDVCTMNADGTGQITNLTNSLAGEQAPSWGPKPTLSR
jgi:TolB protein